MVELPPVPAKRLSFGSASFQPCATSDVVGTASLKPPVESVSGLS